MDRERVYTLPFNWSKTVWVITFGYFIIAVVLIGLLVWEIACGGVVGGVLGFVIALPMLVGIALYCEGYSPQRLEVSESQIIVLRRYDSVTILRSTILSIEPITAKDMRWTVNMGGCGGLFGYFGGFSNRKLGRFTMYATSMDDLLIMRLADGRKIVIGCAEPELLQK